MSRTTGSSSTTIMDEFILAIVVGVRFARKQGVLSKSFMRKRFWFFCLRRWVGFCRCAGIRVLLFVCWRCRAVCLPLRWHPRIVFVLHALPRGGGDLVLVCPRKE